MRVVLAGFPLTPVLSRIERGQTIRTILVVGSVFHQPHSMGLGCRWFCDLEDRCRTGIHDVVAQVERIRADGSTVTLSGHVIGSAIQTRLMPRVVFSIAGAWKGLSRSVWIETGGDIVKSCGSRLIRRRSFQLSSLVSASLLRLEPILILRDGRYFT